MVFGRFDRIIPPRQGERLQSMVGAHCHTLVLEGGHRLLHAHNLSGLSAIFPALTKNSPT
jgi:hypothetical protein